MTAPAISKFVSVPASPTKFHKPIITVRHLSLDVQSEPAKASEPVKPKQKYYHDGALMGGTSAPGSADDRLRPCGHPKFIRYLLEKLLE